MSQQVCDAGVSCIIVYLQEVMEWVFVLLNVHAATRRWYECAAKTTLKRMFNESVWICSWTPLLLWSQGRTWPHRTKGWEDVLIWHELWRHAASLPLKQNKKKRMTKI